MTENLICLVVRPLIPGHTTHDNVSSRLPRLLRVSFPWIGYPPQDLLLGLSLVNSTVYRQHLGSNINLNTSW